MYTGILDLHSLVRWAVVVLGVVAIIAALTGSRWTPQQASLGRWLTIAVDVQAELGALGVQGRSGERLAEERCELLVQMGHADRAALVDHPLLEQSILIQ